MKRVVGVSAWLLALFALDAGATEKSVSVAVMDLAGRGVDEAAAGALTTEVSNTLASLRVFRVITREDIKRMVQLEQTRQQCSGEVDAQCMAEIGGALGVDFLIYGEAAKIADTYSLSLVLLDIGKAEATNRVNKKIAETRMLLEDTDAATKLLVQPLLESKRGFLVLEVRETGAKVSVDGRVVGVSPLSGRMDLSMGAHEVVVEKTGFLTWARTLDVPPNQATVEPVALMPSEQFIEDYESSAENTRIFAWATAGAAVALAGTGAILRLVGDAKFGELESKQYIDRRGICAELNPNYDGNDFCPTTLGYENGVLDDIETINRTDAIALAALIGGVTSAVVSVVLFVTGDDPNRYESYGATVTSKGAAFTGRF